MGVNKLLKAGIAKETLQLKDGASRKSEKAGTEKKITSKSKTTATAKKRKGGRPTNKELGLEDRKQYSLTLKENDYNLFLEAARAENMSFAKFMERAAYEYIRHHKE